MLSKQAAGLVAKRGYSNVMIYMEGIPGWAAAGYPLHAASPLPKVDVPSTNADQLNGMLAEVQIVDIRPESTYQMGWIKGSLKIPLSHLSERYGEIPKGKKLVIVDHAGNQVLVAGRFLKSKGYDDVHRLQGGLMAWVGQGLPLDK